MTPSPVEQAVKAAGGQTALARLIGVTQAHVWKWLQSGRIPAERVLAVETATGISRYELREDVYGPAPDSPAVRLNQFAWLW